MKLRRARLIAHRQHGFTLLELLVVFVLVALISTLLIQGLSYVLHLRERFVEQQTLVQRDALREYWFRSSLRSLMAIPAPKYQGASFMVDKPSFRADRRTIEGVTLAPLHAPGGAPVAIRWEIVYQDGYSVLRYRPAEGDAEPGTGGEAESGEESQIWNVARWRGEEGGFRFRDDDGKWHDQWPPAMGSAQPQIPYAIEFDDQTGPGGLYWLIVVPGQRDPSDYLTPLDG